MDWTDFWRTCDTDRLFLELAIAFQAIPAAVGIIYTIIRHAIKQHKEGKCSNQ